MKIVRSLYYLPEITFSLTSFGVMYNSYPDISFWVQLLWKLTRHVIYLDPKVISMIELQKYNQSN